VATKPHDWNASIIKEFRANEGKVGGFFAGKPVLLLHHAGAKSGTERVNPLMYRKEGDKYAVFASKGGAPEPPAWYLNLEANPEVQVQVLGDRFTARARTATPEEKPELWRTMTAEWPAYDEYQQKTERQIPVVILERA